MDPRRFNVDDDLSYINFWLRKRSKAELTKDELPPRGYIIPGFCCLFLIADGNVGLLDGLVSNPDAHAKDRQAAIKAVIQKCIEEARLSGVKSLMFLTAHGSVMRYGEEFGFKFQRLYNLYEKEL